MGVANGNAEVLRRGLKSLRATTDFTRNVMLPGVLGLTGVIAALGSFVSPKGPGSSDHNARERIANVLTSIPFVLVGCHTVKKRRTANGKLYGASLMGVGAASMTFHASSGEWRCFARKMDYWAIAVSTACMNTAVFPGVHPLVWGLGVLFIPFKPFAVSSINTSAMEAEYLRRAHKNPELRPAQLLHSSTCGLGLGCFCCEEKAPQTPLLHSVWHLTACLSCATTNGLLADVENSQFARAQQLAVHTSS
ncbi:hypothetical protein BSKO_04345 [Bryopsis sp. KO-2023]|nr:hypothetical protein BSKO_04345 [Bryopsis sp. KO-2023]